MSLLFNKSQSLRWICSVLEYNSSVTKTLDLISVLKIILGPTINDRPHLTIKHLLPIRLVFNVLTPVAHITQLLVLFFHLLLDLLQVGSQVHVDRVLGAQQSFQHGVSRHTNFLQPGSLELSPQVHNLDVEVSDLIENHVQFILYGVSLLFTDVNLLMKLLAKFHELVLGVRQLQRRTFLCKELLPLVGLHCCFSVQQIISHHQHTALQRVLTPCRQSFLGGHGSCRMLRLSLIKQSCQFVRVTQTQTESESPM